MSQKLRFAIRKSKQGGVGSEENFDFNRLGYPLEINPSSIVKAEVKSIINKGTDIYIQVPGKKKFNTGNDQPRVMKRERSFFDDAQKPFQFEWNTPSNPSKLEIKLSTH